MADALRRLKEMAQAWQRRNCHEKYPARGHSGDVETCTHPDCVLVRAPLAGPVDANPERVKALARSFAAEWIRPSDPDHADHALLDSLQTVILAFFAAAHRFGPADASGEPEICICAAIQMDNGIVLRGHRHDDCFHTAQKYGYSERITSAKQGFVTSRNRFVSREDGAELQRAAGIKSAMTGGYTGLLFSEDLYFNDAAAPAAASVPPVVSTWFCRQCPEEFTDTRLAAAHSRHTYHVITSNPRERAFVSEAGAVADNCARCGHPRGNHRQILDPEADPAPRYFGYCHQCGREGKQFPATHHDFEASAPAAADPPSDDPPYRDPEWLPESRVDCFRAGWTAARTDTHRHTQGGPTDARSKDA